MTAPVMHRVELDLPVVQAFELFVHGMARRWPFKGHSCGGGDAIDVVVEGYVGCALNLIHDGWAVRGANADDVRNGYLHG